MLNKQKNKFRRALFVGRFQPFHLGHMWMIEKALKQAKELIIAVGSAEDNHQKENPFTASERAEMILEALLEKGISRDRFFLMPVRNINNYDLWVKHLENLLPMFEAIFTGSGVVQNLFSTYSCKYQVVFFSETDKELDISATSIREAILAGDIKRWEKMVPPAVSSFLRRIDAERRLKFCE